MKKEQFLFMNGACLLKNEYKTLIPNSLVIYDTVHRGHLKGKKKQHWILSINAAFLLFY
jgi:hypothetical protein